MKSYTDLEQSKKLAEILPFESADMHYSTWTILDGEFIVSPNYGNTIEDLQEDYGNQIIPCWSLAALLSLIKDKYGYFDLVYLKRTVDGRANPLEDVHRFSTDVYDVYKKEAIDACYEMVLKLHELNLL